MATGAMQSTSLSKPSLVLNLIPSRPNPTETSSSTPSASAPFMTARSSVVSASSSPIIVSSRTPSPRSPRRPNSPSAPSFVEEIDTWMDNIGRLLNALEDQHRRRQFGISSRSRDDGDTRPAKNSSQDGGELRRGIGGVGDVLASGPSDRNTDLDGLRRFHTVAGPESKAQSTRIAR
ncbi:hypothetical protein B0H10DRAFT_1947902 [Mycena sp. CBHHK59/15]|nr:hypothetical protein B0H10DRAFT_1947902 [Mycena sp. CBHHK59/15]